MPAPHQPVPANFRQDRCRADRFDRLVPSDDMLECELTIVPVEFRKLVTVDPDMVGRDPQLQDGALHRDERCLQNIDLVDLFRPCKRKREGVSTLAYRTRKSRTLTGRQALGVSQSRHGIRVVEYDRCSNHGPCQRPTASFIHTGDTGAMTGKSETLLVCH